MINWWLKLMTCKCCEVYRQQLEYERAVNQELIETITSQVKPREIRVSEGGSDSIAFRPTNTPSKMRARLEREDRIKAINHNSPHVARPDIEKLEEVLGLDQEKKPAAGE